MTTPQQNAWARYLEDASQREIRQMAEYAIDHLDKVTDLTILQIYLMQAIRFNKPR